MTFNNRLEFMRMEYNRLRVWGDLHKDFPSDWRQLLWCHSRTSKVLECNYKKTVEHIDKELSIKKKKR